MSTPKNNRVWTLAMVKAANLKAGRFFFTPKNMAFAGDTMKNLRVVKDRTSGRIFVERKQVSRTGMKPAMWRFFPEDGALRFEMNPPLARK